eukprot:TRINITY_DN7653_c1_g4_i1.p1 TRINITY_DN7653_c1_g4~~TRINITY_DN7653_c1_g4_i1.p1  ORF type:complete len:185 (+),score=58.05 TRINITY_DN7653_c1_g4_i1:123-677(+)
MSQQQHNLFVCDILQSAYSDSELVLGSSKLVGTAVASGSPYRLMHNSESDIVRVAPAPSGAARLQGEVWCVDDGVLRTLDQMEGVDKGQATRQKLTVEAAGKACPCVVYVASAAEVEGWEEVVSGCAQDAVTPQAAEAAAADGEEDSDGEYGDVEVAVGMTGVGAAMAMLQREPPPKRRREEEE